MARTPQPGDPAPAFDLESTTGQRLTLDDLSGKPAVLFFFPKARSPG